MRKRRGFSGNAAPIGVRWLLKAMPWPGKLENILCGIGITVCHIATARTDMGSDRQTFVGKTITSPLLTHKIGSWPHLGLTARLLPKRRGTHKKASLPKPPERLVLEGNFSEQTLCHSKQATCMPPKWP